MFPYKNIVLRKIEKIDLPILLELKQESWLSHHQTIVLNSVDQEQWFNSLNNNHKTLILIATKEQQSFGVIKLTNIDTISRKTDMSWDIFAPYRGTSKLNERGLATTFAEAGCTFAFKVLNLRRIDGEILENNKAALKLAYQVGFIQEGLKRQAIYKQGRYINSIVIGLLEPEFKADQY
jgi:RimJ/RimL family protein N-acetyltransferase